jgi:AraC-like DNA-binding protein
MLNRRRIDWEVILSPGTYSPEWGTEPAPSDLVSSLVFFNELFQIADADVMLRRAVEMAVHSVGLVRAGLYLYDESLDLMLGTWGTSLNREIIDEHYSMFEAGNKGRYVFNRAISAEAHWTVVEDCPLIEQNANETTLVGRGWVVCTPIRFMQRPLGMLYNDAGVTGNAVEPTRQLQAALLCSVVGAVLANPRETARSSGALIATAKHSTVARITQMLAQDPTLCGKTMAASVGISLSRLARLFKSELGQSLVTYRNRLRLERFFQLVDNGETSLLDAALTSGFGSYAQFHRVFCAMYKQRPRDYLLARERSVLPHK